MPKKVMGTDAAGEWLTLDRCTITTKGGEVLASVAIEVLSAEFRVVEDGQVVYQGASFDEATTAHYDALEGLEVFIDAAGHAGVVLAVEGPS